MNNCHICHCHGLTQMDFSPENNASSDTYVSKSESEIMPLSKFTICIKMKVVTCLKCM